MPWAPKRPCTYPGCGELTDSRRCPLHENVEKKAADVRRGTAASRGYGGRWEKARRTFLLQNPLCAECARQGRTTMADLVDHIQPAKGNQELFWEPENWQALCTACHNGKTNKRDGGFGNRIKEIA